MDVWLGFVVFVVGLWQVGWFRVVKGDVRLGFVIKKAPLASVTARVPTTIGGSTNRYHSESLGIIARRVPKG